ncbi:phenylalanine--tRNA ligase subunit beta [Govanella unica]|uniref:Phenylalanine--tRNA ligase beta subunit n=1 Tax=Govanella unica TaxID=2975056 RepID=A0A9X3TWF8_9PROT|nr:phenylalanine--tRNA ligase subunit beta [Govania unica]MDA5192970.1 phenylalanine--tRNA ligase subunit beta [Govania unica]
MKLTLNWLKDHLDTTATVTEVAEKLTAVGLEVEEIIDPAAKLAPFIIAEVKATEQHPNAERLRLCTVDTGTETLQVVCGASNARAGIKVVFAPSGSYIPGSKMTLKPTEIRGVLSTGMMCSERELELSEEHEGIIELPMDAPLGGSFAQYAGFDDPVIDIAITPNRPDCLGITGIARDLAAAGLGAFKSPAVEPVKGSFPCPVPVRIESDAASACPLFVGRLIRGVKNGPSPKWLQDRLKALGLRPISALVDITNYLCYDRARPLHVYDADKLSGGIIVRLGREGETLDALDNKTYELTDRMCVIADEAGPLGLAGVIGGTPSGSTEGTLNVFVEAALFDPIRTAETGRATGVLSDARFRFERGVDPDGTIPGLELATRLILDLCGGEPSELVIAGEIPNATKIVTFRPDRVRTLGGLDLPAESSIAILTSLGFTVEGSGASLSVRVPSWRPDVDGEADLVEEVLRIHGYDAIPSVPLDRPMPPKGVLTSRQKRTRLVRRTLATRGLREAVTWSFLSAKDAQLFGGGQDCLMLANPISSELDCMRPSLLPNLIAALGRNADRGFHDLGLFEIGSHFENDTAEGQILVAAGVRGGMTGDRHWTAKPQAVDAYVAKADVMGILTAAGAPVDNLVTSTDSPSFYHPGRSGVLKLGPKMLARFGEIHPGVLKALDVDGPVVAFEVFLDALPLPKAKSRSRGPLKVSDFQAVERDFAFVVNRDVTAEDILRAARGVDKTLITAASVFDVYQGKGVEDGQKSVAISLTLQAQDRTLTDQDIDGVANKVIEAVAKKTNATLRG